MSYADSLRLVLPEVMVACGLLVLLVWDLIVPKRRYWESAVVALSFLGVAAAYLIPRLSATPVTVFAMVRVDAYAAIFQLVVVAAAATTVIMNVSNPRFPRDRGRVETQVLLLGATLGAMVMVGTRHLLMMYLGFEALSLSCYALVNVHKRDRAGAEAAMKFVVYGALSSAVMLYGISLFFGLGGSFDLGEIGVAVSRTLAAGHNFQVLLPTLLLLAGFGYKMSLVPFHWWSPDVYHGTTTPIASFLATGSKIVALATLVRVLAALFAGEIAGGAIDVASGAAALSSMVPDLRLFLAIGAALSMLLGSLAALQQQHLRRLLAYSSISHAGFLLAAVAMLGADGFDAALLYGLCYAVMGSGTFVAVLYFCNQSGADEVASLRGLGWRHPLAGTALVILLAGLIGLPPTAGFSGKLRLLQAVVAEGYLWLALIMVLASLLSAFYSFRIVRVLFLEDRPSADAAVASAAATASGASTAGDAEAPTAPRRLPLLVLLLAVFTAATLLLLDLDPLAALTELAVRDLIYW